MNKRKLTLGIASSLVALSGLAACNEVTYSEGVVLSYTDNAGQVVKFTAEDLFGEYIPTSGSASTAFSTVQEALIRHYYEKGEGKSQLDELKKKANNDVVSVKSQAKTNADNNKTSYEKEWENLLSAEGCVNVDELFEKKLYVQEKSAYEEAYYSQKNLNGIRDGKKWEALDTAELVKKYGSVSKGYLDEKMPYHVSHILVKLSSASNNEHTEDTISESEAKKLSEVVKELAGAKTDEAGDTNVAERQRFGTIALNLSEDTESSKKYGDLGIMDKDTSFVQEFKLGVYAYDALYNAGENLSAEKKANLLPSDEAKTIDGTDAEEFFSKRGIGTMPYGAFVALGNSAVAKSPDLGYTVNDGNEHFYPRNVLFNKYLNTHTISVITPNDIPFNDYLAGKAATGFSTEAADYSEAYAAEWDAVSKKVKTAGKANAAYAALQGFTEIALHDEKGNVVNQKVLTNEKGQVVLAVRAGTSSYQGIHFIVVDRSALMEYASYNSATGGMSAISATEYDSKKNSNDVTSLSEYYTMITPDKTPSTIASADESVYYPSYEADGKVEAKTTYVNKLTTTDSAYKSNADAVKSKVKGYDSHMDTYMFEELMTAGTVTFGDSAMAKAIENKVETYIKTTREDAAVTAKNTFDDSWTAYADYLMKEDEDRQIKEDGTQKLISEVCAIGYGSANAKDGKGVWAKGGACYDGK